MTASADDFFNDAFRPHDISLALATVGHDCAPDTLEIEIRTTNRRRSESTSIDLTIEDAVRLAARIYELVASRRRIGR